MSLFSLYRIEFLIVPAFLLSLVWNGSDKFSIFEILWAFSIYLESVAILPQLFMIQVLKVYFYSQFYQQRLKIHCLEGI
jgi:hypothetical protein